jgi:hypothetical protein
VAAALERARIGIVDAMAKQRASAHGQAPALLQELARLLDAIDELLGAGRPVGEGRAMSLLHRTAALLPASISTDAQQDG